MKQETGFVSGTGARRRPPLRKAQLACCVVAVCSGAGVGARSSLACAAR
ncbi:hypothetical protein A2U01_0051453, partial [Trifolium medium]|nr:hypothetical protein [Trifolium medium]